MQNPNATEIGDALAIATYEIVHAILPDTDMAQEKLELISGFWLDAIRNLVSSPTRDIIQTAAEVLVKSEV